jgi:hypothetical protein
MNNAGGLTILIVPGIGFVLYYALLLAVDAIRRKRRKTPR